MPAVTAMRILHFHFLLRVDFRDSLMIAIAIQAYFGDRDFGD
jgi:hypothetical protein